MVSAGIAASDYAEAAGVRCSGGHDTGGVGALVLAKSLVVAKDKGSPLQNRAAGRGAELIAAKLCDLAGSVALVAGIECGVAEEFVRRVVKLIGAGAADCVDDAAG